ncbi:MAG: AP2/ERF family transcription factor [Pseudomonadota bacterium]
MKLIPLTQGMVATIDDCDYKRAAAFRWQAVLLHGKYYAARSVTVAFKKRATVFLHQYILGKPPEGQEVDHISGDGLDNRRCNLRLCSHQQNMANRKKQRKATSSAWKGVHRHTQTGRWVARIGVDGRRISLGCFGEEIEAARAYDWAAKQIWGEYAATNLGR